MLKEVRLAPNTGRHDLLAKSKTARSLLLSEGIVKLTVVLRGREISHPERGVRLLRILTEQLKGIGKVESPQLRGRLLSVIVSLRKRKKDEEGGARVPAYPRSPAPTLHGAAQAAPTRDS